MSDAVHVGVYKGRGICLCLVDLFASLNGILGLTLPAEDCPHYQEAILQTLSLVVDDDVPVDISVMPVRHLESICDPHSCQFPKRDLQLLLGICTERPRPTCTKIFHQASKMVPIPWASGILWRMNDRPGCVFCGRGQPLLALDSWIFNEVVWVSIRLHELIILC